MSTLRWAAPVVLIVIGGIVVAGQVRKSPAPGPAPAAAPEPGPAPDEGATIATRVPPPTGYEFVPAQPGSFAAWLAELPVKPGRPPVLLYNGRRKGNQSAHHAVIDLDVGKRDLQQCADAIIRLRAEYLWAAGRRDDIHFNFTSGDRADYSRWREGARPVVRGETVTWVRSAGRDDSYECFRAYLDTVFAYAGTYSLSQELSPVPDAADIQIGDVFIRGGFPGHAVVVVSMAAHRETGERVFLLAQSYIPAQDIHVLRNPADADLSPWYSLDFGDMLRTPEYTFRRDELRRF